MICLSSVEQHPGGFAKEYYVDILASRSRTPYIGITNGLGRRVDQHKGKLVPGFTSRYNITRLVCFEVTGDVKSALEREKELKGWSRARKVALIDAANPTWEDFSAYGSHALE